MSYESPIDIIYGDVQTKLEGDVFKAIQNCNIKVDKDELLKALAYDRNQYHKGWLDGYAQAAEDVVRHGHWEYEPSIYGNGFYKCSVCGEAWSHWWATVVPVDRMNYEMKYCPHCGAKMDGERRKDE